MQIYYLLSDLLNEVASRLSVFTHISRWSSGKSLAAFICGRGVPLIQARLLAALSDALFADYTRHMAII